MRRGPVVPAGGGAGPLNRRRFAALLAAQAGVSLAARAASVRSSPPGLPESRSLHPIRSPHPTSMKKIIRPAAAAAPVGPYSHAVRIGSLLFCSGQIPLDPVTGRSVEGDIRVQTERVLENIRIILEDQGLGFPSVVKSTVFMTNLGEFAGMNEIYARYFPADFPARSTVQVVALPRGAAVEIEVVASFA